MTPFDVSGKEAFAKHCGKRRKCWKPAFSPLPTMFPTLSKTGTTIYFTFIWSSEFGQGQIFAVWEWVSIFETGVDPYQHEHPTQADVVQDINFLPDETILDWSKLKEAFADNKAGWFGV